MHLLHVTPLMVVLHVRMVSGILNVNYPAAMDALMELVARMVAAVHAKITGMGVDVILAYLEDMAQIVN